MAVYKDESSLVNLIAKQWGDKQAQEIKAQISSLGIGKTGKLLKSIKAKYHYQYGEIDRIAIHFIRYGIMVNKGVGGGGFGIKETTAAIKRKVKPFITNVMTDEAISNLANKIVLVKADAQIKSFNI